MLLAKVLTITFVLSCIYILGVPREYSTDLKLAPELSSSGSVGGLEELASSFGIDMTTMNDNDAITPLLYPDLMDDDAFATFFFNLDIKDSKGIIDCSYYEYLNKHQNPVIWTVPFIWVKRTITNLFSKSQGGTGVFDPYSLNEKDKSIADKVRNNISISIDKKSGIITIQTSAQDPLIAKTLANATKEHLQGFITNYRTNKARIDYAYYKQLTDSARIEYEDARIKYSNYADANIRTVLQSYRSRESALESDMQIKFNTYSALVSQMESARSKIQANTPAFTIIKGASLPVKASKPKRMLFVLGMMILVTLLFGMYCIKDRFILILKA